MVVSARSWGCTGLAIVILAAGARLSSPSPVVTSPPPTSTYASTSAAPVVAAAWDGAPSPAGAPMPEAPPAFDGPAPAPTPPPPMIDQGSGGDGTWAVVVGIDDYPGGSHDLRSARNDASDMAAVLTAAGVPPERQIRLADGQATADVLRRALDWLVARAGPDATAVFFFAGHVRQLGSGTEALVGADGRLVHDTEVAHRLRNLRAAQTWIVLATCYGGGFDEVLAPGRILTAAAPAGELAYENLRLRRSYLVEYVVRRAMLEGEAPRSVEAAFAWGEAAIRRDHPRRLPVQFDWLDGELVLGVPTTAVVARSPRSDGRPPPSPPPTTTTTTVPNRESEEADEEAGCGITLGTLVHCPDERPAMAAMAGG